MIFRVILLISVSHGVLGDATIPKESMIGTDTEASAAESQFVCDICSCKDAIVDCVNRGLEDQFEDNQWPQDPMVEVNCQGNDLVHIKQYPALVINKLILRNNTIVRIDAAAFKNLRNLTELDLSHNLLTSDMLNPHVFEGRFSPEANEPLAKLTVLRLSNNDLHTLHQDLFAHVLNLKVLTLDGNPLYVIDYSTTLAVGNLPYLEELDLSFCDLVDLPDHLFHTPRYLTKLHLKGNIFTAPPIALEDAKALEYVSMDENPMESIDKDNAFPEMPQLKELSLCRMYNLTRVGQGAFSRLGALEVLHMEGCPQLTEIDEAFSRYPTSDSSYSPPLKRLGLADNALRYIPDLPLGEIWYSLQSLNLSNNPLSCDCDNQGLIKHILPNYGRLLMGKEVDNLTCASPPEHEGKTLISLADQDICDPQGGRNTVIWIGSLIGALLAVTVIMMAFFFWRRRHFDSQRRSIFTRGFYRIAENEEDF